MRSTTSRVPSVPITAVSIGTGPSGRQDRQHLTRLIPRPSRWTRTCRYKSALFIREARLRRNGQDPPQVSSVQVRSAPRISDQAVDGTARESLRAYAAAEVPPGSGAGVCECRRVNGIRRALSRRGEGGPHHGADPALRVRRNRPAGVRLPGHRLPRRPIASWTPSPHGCDRSLESISRRRPPCSGRRSATSGRRPAWTSRTAGHPRSRRQGSGRADEP